MNKSNIIVVIVLCIVVLVLKNIKITKAQKENMEYNKNVITNKDSNIYVFYDNEKEKIGTIAKGEELELAPIYKEEYYKIANWGKDYYISYRDVDKIDKLTSNEKRYKKYIPYNKNIITKENTSLYDENNNLLYSINSTMEFEIIINKSNYYGVEFNNKLLYIKNKDILKTKSNSNSNLKNTEGIAVLNYHAVYKPKVDTCNSVICHSVTQFESHLKYIKDNNIFTPTLKELEMYLDGYIQLPKSVVITLDDGWLAESAAELLNKYELNGTVFLISAWYDPKKLESKYVETHSHTHKMHNAGDCPGGQGGGIKCLSEQHIQEDLKNSRKKLNNTTYFCYPFYEFNNYSISQLKKAGFTMAFGGYNENGQLKAKPGIDKFRVPRYVIYSYTTVNEIKQYIG